MLGRQGQVLAHIIIVVLLLAFVGSQSVEVFHPLEAAAAGDHEHDEPVLEPAPPPESDFCLHQQHLASFILLNASGGTLFVPALTPASGEPVYATTFRQLLLRGPPSCRCQF